MFGALQTHFVWVTLGWIETRMDANDQSQNYSSSYTQLPRSLPGRRHDSEAPEHLNDRNMI